MFLIRDTILKAKTSVGWEEGHMGVTEQETGSRSQRRSDCLWVSPDITGWKHSNNVLTQFQPLLCSFLRPKFFFIFSVYLLYFFDFCFLSVHFFSLSFHLLNSVSFFPPFSSSCLCLRRRLSFLLTMGCSHKVCSSFHIPMRKERDAGKLLERGTGKVAFPI